MGLNSDNNIEASIDKKVSLKEKIEGIYGWHNGLMIAQSLKYMTEDESYMFLERCSSEGMTFVNDCNDKIFIDEDGYLIKPKGLSIPIEKVSTKRLERTKKMIDMLLFE